MMIKKCALEGRHLSMHRSIFKVRASMAKMILLGIQRAQLIFMQDSGGSYPRAAPMGLSRRKATEERTESLRVSKAATMTASSLADVLWSSNQQ